MGAGAGAGGGGGDMKGGRSVAPLSSSTWRQMAARLDHLRSVCAVRVCKIQSCCRCFAVLSDVVVQWNLTVCCCNDSTKTAPRHHADTPMQTAGPSDAAHRSATVTCAAPAASAISGSGPGPPPSTSTRGAATPAAASCASASVIASCQRPHLHCVQDRRQQGCLVTEHVCGGQPRSRCRSGHKTSPLSGSLSNSIQLLNGAQSCKVINHL